MIIFREELIAGHTVYKLTNEAETVSFSLLPHKGAALLDLHLYQNYTSRQILKNWLSPETGLDDHFLKFGGSQLFPFPNRLAGGRYNFEGKDYHFPNNDFGRPNALHGHLHDKRFELVSWNSHRSELPLPLFYPEHLYTRRE